MRLDWSSRFQQYFSLRFFPTMGFPCMLLCYEMSLVCVCAHVFDTYNIIKLWHLQFRLYLGLHDGGATSSLNGDLETFYDIKNCLFLHPGLTLPCTLLSQKVGPWHPTPLSLRTMVLSTLVPDPILGPILPEASSIQVCNLKNNVPRSA